MLLFETSRIYTGRTLCDAVGSLLPHLPAAAAAAAVPCTCRMHRQPLVPFWTP
jgi:hypothetical protein